MAESEIKPPRIADRILRWFCSERVLEFLQGDLYELYAYRLGKYGKIRAGFHYFFDVLSACRPFAFKKSRSNSNSIAMFENYLKVAWRGILRQKMFASIKIGGFAIGIATCILITLFVRHELSYDSFYENSDRIFKFYSEVKMPGIDDDRWSAMPAPIGHILNTEFPEIEKAGRLIPYKGWFDAGDNLFRRGDQTQNMFEDGFAYADPSWMEILQVKMVYGDRSQALQEPNSIVIAKSIADKYFQHENPVGQTVFLNDDETKPYKIGGVMENFPSNSHLDFDFLITLSGLEFWPGEQTSWCCWNYVSYIQVKPGTDVQQLQDKMATIRDNHYLAYLKETGDASMDDVSKFYRNKLQPVTDIYLRPQGMHDGVKEGDIRFVWLFAGVAVFILLLACINFINLSTAKSANRAKEVGLRKVVGSIRSNLVRQFLTESILFSVISFVLGLLLAWSALPYFNGLADQRLHVPIGEWWFLPALIAAALVIGILAGLYPAFYLSGFKPIEVLKGSVSRGSRSSKLRGAMVIFQFTTSTILIIGTFVIYRQMQYIMNKKIGFDKDQVVMIQGANTLGDDMQTLKTELLTLPGVKNVAVSSYLPVAGTHRDQNSFWKEGKSREDIGVGAQKWYVDEDYLPTLGIELQEGRNFDKKLASDSQVIIINQAMVKELGLKDPLNERIQNNREVYQVIGVVEDFHFESLKGEIRPLAFVQGSYGDIISVKLDTESMKGVLASITSTWDTFSPNQPIRYTFLDESYARMYEDVQRTGRIFTVFAILAILVACLGLFALSAFMVEQRGKEISIRIVLGASGHTIFRLLTTNFIRLIMISLVVAIPTGWYLMREWLDDYTYHTEITWEIFLIAGFIALFIAILTISVESLKASRMNPIKNLRSE